KSWWSRLRRIRCRRAPSRRCASRFASSSSSGWFTVIAEAGRDLVEALFGQRAKARPRGLRERAVDEPVGEPVSGARGVVLLEAGAMLDGPAGVEPLVLPDGGREHER